MIVLKQFWGVFVLWSLFGVISGFGLGPPHTGWVDLGKLGLSGTGAGNKQLSDYVLSICLCILTL